MDLERHYTNVEKAEDAEMALASVFFSQGDTYFTAEKRVGECFLTRGKGRKIDPDLFSSIKSSSEAYDDSDDELLEEVSGSIIKLLNSYLESKIDEIEKEYEDAGKILKHTWSLVRDLKAIYAIILSKLEITSEMHKFISPNIDNMPWKEVWTIDHLSLSPELINYPNKDILPPSMGETKLLKSIKDKIIYDRMKILDDLIIYFSENKREDVVEIIKVRSFEFINTSVSGIYNKFELSEEDFEMVTKARVEYISKRKVDLNYSLRLVNLPATTYKKRSKKLKSEIYNLGDSLNKNDKDLMHGYLLD